MMESFGSDRSIAMADCPLAGFFAASMYGGLSWSEHQQLNPSGTISISRKNEAKRPRCVAIIDPLRTGLSVELFLELARARRSDDLYLLGQKKGLGGVIGGDIGVGVVGFCMNHFLPNCLGTGILSTTSQNCLVLRRMNGKRRSKNFLKC